MSNDEKEQRQQQPLEPPNGGARAWGVVLGAFAAQMYSSIRPPQITLLWY